MEDREHGVILHNRCWSKTCTLIALSLSRGSNVGAVLEKVSLSNLHVRSSYAHVARIDHLETIFGVIPLPNCSPSAKVKRITVSGIQRYGAYRLILQLGTTLGTTCNTRMRAGWPSS
jgi:hypothetical protein